MIKTRTLFLLCIVFFNTSNSHSTTQNLCPNYDFFPLLTKDILQRAKNVISSEFRITRIPYTLNATIYLNTHPPTLSPYIVHFISPNLIIEGNRNNVNFADIRPDNIVIITTKLLHQKIVLQK